MSLEFLKNIIIWNNSLYTYLYSLFIFVVLFLLLKLFQRVILLRLEKLALKTKTEIDDSLIKVVREIKPPVYLIIAAYFALNILKISNLGFKVLKFLFVVAIIYEVIRAIENFIGFWLDKYSQKLKQKGKLNLSMIYALKLVIRFILWTIGLLLLLSNMGVNITSLVASLGIGGIAVALAVQNILSDIFSSFSIFIDQPFQIGDFVVIGEHSGTVEKIGLKTTRIRTLRGEELIVSNRELTSARIQNFKKLQKRRIVFTIGVEYSTGYDKLQKIPEIVQEIIQKNNNTEFERCFFKEYGDSSLNFEISYYILSNDYHYAMSVVHKINLEIYRRFEENKIAFAFPTRTVHLIK